MENEFLIGLIKHNEKIVEELNRHSSTIKAISERLSIAEAELIELRKKHSSPTQSAMASPGQVSELHSTKAYNHLRGLGVI